MKPRWFGLPSHDPSSKQGKDELGPIPFDSMWPEQRLFLVTLLRLPLNAYMYGRVDYDTTMPPGELPNGPRNDLEICTENSKHRLRSWRFVRTTERC